jgi:hypothetical protein
VIANWDGVEPSDHPTNAPEVMACSVTDNNNIYFDGGDWGGTLILDFSLAGFGGQPSTILLESNIFRS